MITIIYIYWKSHQSQYDKYDKITQNDMINMGSQRLKIGDNLPLTDPYLQGCLCNFLIDRICWAWHMGVGY